MKKTKAYEIAIKAMQLKQRQYSTGHYEFMRRGPVFDFAKRDHKQFMILETAIEILEDERIELIRQEHAESEAC